MLDLNKLEEEIGEDLVRAAKKHVLKIEGEIEKTLKKLQEIDPKISYVSGNGTFFIYSTPIKYEDEGEEFEFVLDDLVDDTLANEKRNYNWENLPTEIEEPFIYLCKLLDFRLSSKHWKYL